MPLKEKNKFTVLAPALLLLLLVACNNGGTGHDTGEVNDSISKANQRRAADSLKKTNPLLIVPPDSTYTGDYIDKYPSGIVKFRGQFRFGQRHGQWMSFYPNGEAWSELHYDKGLRNGPNITYYPGGQIRYSGYYKNDMQDSLCIYYDSLGKPAEKIIYKKDRIFKRLGPS
jgi:hypothetical protein